MNTSEAIPLADKEALSQGFQFPNIDVATFLESFQNILERLNRRWAMLVMGAGILFFPTPDAHAVNLNSAMIPNETPISQVGGCIYYTVQYGDTLYGIATRHGTTFSEIAEVNGIKNPNLIYAGDCLVIPGSDQTSPVLSKEELQAPLTKFPDLENQIRSSPEVEKWREYQFPADNYDIPLTSKVKGKLKLWTRVIFEKYTNFVKGSFSFFWQSFKESFSGFGDNYKIAGFFYALGEFFTVDLFKTFLSFLVFLLSIIVPVGFVGSILSSLVKEVKDIPKYCANLIDGGRAPKI